MLRLVLFDLDDTLLRAYACPEEAWRKVAVEFARHLPLPVAEMTDALARETRAFWADGATSIRWRQDVIGARREIARRAFAGLPATGDLAVAMADRFSRLREEEMALFPDALPVLSALRAAGMRLALLCNGQAALQRGKLGRFGLAGQFDHIQIEAEAGVGKPDPEAYRLCLRSCGIRDPGDAAMVGDNLEWDVIGPKRCGLRGIWFNPAAIPLPDNLEAAPDHIATSLTEACNYLTERGPATR